MESIIIRTTNDAKCQYSPILRERCGGTQWRGMVLPSPHPSIAVVCHSGRVRPSALSPRPSRVSPLLPSRPSRPPTTDHLPHPPSSNAMTPMRSCAATHPPPCHRHCQVRANWMILHNVSRLQCHFLESPTIAN